MPRVIASLVALAAVFAQVSAAPTYYASSSEVASSNYAGSSYASNEYAQEKPMAEEKKVEEVKAEEKYVAETTAEKVEAAVATYTSTSSAWSAEKTSEVSYGSGYKNWGGQGYNNCVQQCLATYGKPAATYTAAVAAETTATPTSGGTGTTHTVIVAPTQGVLRFVPFAVNASVGDTVRFMWGAGPHTVTKSSVLNPCNSSADPNSFASGRQNKSFVFDQVVNDTKPTFYYCAVATHCQKGMFGIINPPSGLVANPADAAATESTSKTVGQYVNEMVQTDASMAALVSYVNNKTAGTSAYNWGMGIDMGSMPAEQYGAIAQNAMYSALFYSANPGALEAGQGASDVTGNGVVIPADISQTLASIGATSASTTGDSPAAAAPNNAVEAPSASAPAASVTSLPQTNGSGKLASSTVLVGAVAVLVSFLAL